MVGTWDYVRLKPNIGNSDFFTSNYVKHSSRFNYLQSQPSRAVIKKHVIKHVSVSFQSKIIF